MSEIAYISYSEWTDLISAVIRKGLSCNELEIIKTVYPNAVGDAYDPMIYNQVARLEEYLIKASVDIFQKQMNMCFEENDIEMAEIAFSKLKRHLLNSMFFMQIPYYTESVKVGITGEIKKNLYLFFDAFSSYLKKLELADNSAFVQDYIYICRKRMRTIKRMLEE